MKDSEAELCPSHRVHLARHLSGAAAALSFRGDGCFCPDDFLQSVLQIDSEEASDRHAFATCMQTLVVRRTAAARLVCSGEGGWDVWPFWRGSS